MIFLARTPARIVVTALVLTITLLAMFAPPATAATVLNGKVQVVSNPGARSTLKLRADFGSMANAGTLAFTVHAINRNGVKVMEWQTTSTVRKSEYVVKGYDWNTKTVPDGRYTFAIGLLRNGVVEAWNANAGSVTLGAQGWWFGSTSTVALGGATVVTKYTAPSLAFGTYALRTTVKDQYGRIASQWIDYAFLNGGQVYQSTRALSGLSGRYTVDQEVLTDGLEQRLGIQERSSTFTVTAFAQAPAATTTTSTTARPTTTTTAAPTTTTSTTARPTTTTAAPVTTTTSTTSTTVAPVTTTTTTVASMPTTTTSTTVKPATTTTTAPAYNSSWNLVAQDDFNGTNLDPKWALYSGIGNAGIGTREPYNVKVGNGEATLIGETAKLAGSGMCWCFPGSDTIYGRWEVRARMDKGNGFGPAILLWPESERWPIDGELDIAEMPNGDRKKSHATTHWGADNSQIGVEVGGDFSQWHVFGVDWQEDHVTYFVDGKVIAHHTDPVMIPRTPMHLAIQNDAGEGNSWISAVDANSPAQVNLHVDWVKIYK